MFKFRDFTFGRRDKYNLDLYQIQKVVLGEEGGRGSHLRKKVADEDKGKIEVRSVLIGHFSSVEAVVYKMMILDVEKHEFENMLTAMNDFKKDIKGFLSEIKLTMKNFEPEGVQSGSEEDGVEA